MNISFGYTFTSMSKENRPSSYPLRLPEDLREKLEQSAKENGRPLSSEILMRLEFTFDSDAQKKREKELLDVQELTNKNAQRIAELESMLAEIIRQEKFNQ